MPPPLRIRASLRVLQSLAERVPTVVLDIDGSTDRTSLEFPEIEASEIVVKWEPANGIDPLEVLELNAFGPANLANYAVAMRPDAIAELNADRRADRSKDGKTFADGKTGKELLEPIAEGPMRSRPRLRQAHIFRAPWVSRQISRGLG